VYIYIYIIPTHVCVHIHKHIYYTHTHTRTHANTHTHTHTHEHVYRRHARPTTLVPAHKRLSRPKKKVLHIVTIYIYIYIYIYMGLHRRKKKSQKSEPYYIYYILSLYGVIFFFENLCLPEAPGEDKLERDQSCYDARVSANKKK